MSYTAIIFLLVWLPSSVCCFYTFQLQSDVEKPLLSYRDNFKKDMKKYDHQITDLRKQLASRYAAVEKVQYIVLLNQYSVCTQDWFINQMFPKY